MIELIHGDCMDYIKDLPDNTFDLAIVDPPYGIGNTSISSGNKKRKLKHKKVTWNNEIPSEEYFNNLYRISRNQIIWGCNYFYPHIKVPGRIVHYKKPFQDLSKKKIKFSACDIASQSFNNKIDYFEYNWYGNTQNGKTNWKNTGPDARIHPTQKPIDLYRWILRNYASQGDRIIDTHLGSGSSAIASHDFGFDFVGIEIDENMLKAARRRYEYYIAQLQINY